MTREPNTSTPMGPLLEINGLAKSFSAGGSMFSTNRGKVLAVDRVSLSVGVGETLALVGESGSGKSTVARLALRLLDPTSGTIRFEGRDITRLPQRGLRSLRPRMQMVFQDPYASLDPRLTVRETVEEPLIVHGIGNAASRRIRVDELLGLVNLTMQHASRYPHEFSGGQRQRVGIARALALNPRLVVCDEPVSALDVSIQAQIVNLLKDLQARFGLSYLFIAHDLAVIKHMADRVAVMYLGQLVEIASKEQLFSRPRHPYTRMLLDAVPSLTPGASAERARVSGELPSPLHPPGGCRFHSRCQYATEICRSKEPTLKTSSTGHAAACHHQDVLPDWQAGSSVEISDMTSMRMALYERRKIARGRTLA